MDQDLNLSENNLPYKFYLMPKVGEKYGYLMFTVTHALLDGRSSMSSFEAMTVKKDFSSFRG